jgi:uncharacterized caspase-like protein
MRKVDVRIPQRWLAAAALSALLIGAMVAPTQPSIEAQEQGDARQLKLAETSKQSDLRLALVIGNGAYTNAPPLKNPPNDATDMRDALSRLGFRVEHGLNLSQRQMKAMIREFGQKLKGGGQGLFYYAGHGVQLRGRNYLIPVDADIQSETDVEDQGVDSSLVLGLMDEAGNGLNVVILDACRNNPFARSFRSTSNGLAQVDAPTGTLVAYATAPGRVARDGTGRNGAYTAELLKQMQVPGLPIEELLKRVRANLKQQTNGEQVPWESSSLVGDFYLNKSASTGGQTANSPASGTTTTTNAPTTNSVAIELAYWDSIKSSTNTEDFRAYLKKYPNGEFADIARNRIHSLEAAAKEAAEKAKREREKEKNDEGPVLTVSQPPAPPDLQFEENITYNGDTLTYYHRPTAALCRADCAANQNCKGFTFIRPGGYQPNDPAMCYLISRITGAVSHTCCVSGRRGGSDSGTGSRGVSGSNLSVEYDTDRPGSDYSQFELPQPRYELCRDACASDANCKAYTYVKPSVQGPNATCWLKSSVPAGGPSSCCISGVKR